jgi:hypothetical protein
MRWRGLAALDRRLAGADFDLVHVQTPFAAHYAGMRFARKRRGIPCVATYHTHFEEYLFHYIRFLPRAMLRRRAQPGTPPVQRARRRGGAVGADGRNPANYGVTTAAGDTHRLAGRPVHPRQRPASASNGTSPRRVRWRCSSVAPPSKRTSASCSRPPPSARRKNPHLMLVIAGEGPALPTLRRQAKALRHRGPRALSSATCRATAACATATRRRTCSPLPRGPKPRAWSCSKPWPSACRCWPSLRWARPRSSRRRAARLPAADTPPSSPSNCSSCSTVRSDLRIMADEAIAFAREWDADAQAPAWPRCTACCCAQAACLDHQPVTASR